MLYIFSAFFHKPKKCVDYNTQTFDCLVKADLLILCYCRNF